MNVNVNTITNWNCANYTYDYIDRLVVITLTPFGILAMFFVFFVVQVAKWPFLDLTLYIIEISYVHVFSLIY